MCNRKVVLYDCPKGHVKSETDTECDMKKATGVCGNDNPHESDQNKGGYKKQEILSSDMCPCGKVKGKS